MQDYLSCNDIKIFILLIQQYGNFEEKLLTHDMTKSGEIFPPRAKTVLLFLLYTRIKLSNTQSGREGIRSQIIFAFHKNYSASHNTI